MLIVVDQSQMPTSPIEANNHSSRPAIKFSKKRLVFAIVIAAISDAIGGL
jgi:hypothetical protein